MQRVVQFRGSLRISVSRRFCLRVLVKAVDLRRLEVNGPERVGCSAGVLKAEEVKARGWSARKGESGDG